ncbi:MAG: helix-turn-helix domain-containing protein [Candidatus Gracilibacteria bacterium]|jgi:sugar-specific transcriptional regulator TrmB
MLSKFLQNIGLSEKEAQVFLTMLEIGTNAVNVIAQKACLSRTTVYSILETLENKNLVGYFEKNGIRYYTPERPEVIYTMLNRQIREANIRRNEFENLLPEFLSLLNKDPVTPKVRYFEGLTGIKAIYEDIISEGKNKLSYSCALDIRNNELRKILDEHVSDRVRAGIHVRTIFPNTPEAKKQIKNDKKLLRTSLLVPKGKFPFRSEVNIYGNKVAIISLDLQFHGVIIQSETISETQRSIFELACLGAKGLRAK